MLLRAWSLPLLWCVAMAMLTAGIQRASQPPMAPVRSVEAAASKEARGDALPEATAGYSLHSLPLRTCTVRCDTPFLVLRHRFHLSRVPPQDWAVYLPFFDANLAV